MTYEQLMEILEEEIVGDGQGYPDQDERDRAARRILKALEDEALAISSKDRQT